MLRVLTRESLALSASQRWWDRYLAGRVPSPPCLLSVYEKLVALGENATPEKVNELVRLCRKIDFCAVPKCTVCREVTDIVLELKTGTHVCEGCLKKLKLS